MCPLCALDHRSSTECVSGANSQDRSQRSLHWLHPSATSSPQPEVPSIWHWEAQRAISDPPLAKRTRQKPLSTSATLQSVSGGNSQDRSQRALHWLHPSATSSPQPEEHALTAIGVDLESKDIASTEYLALASSMRDLRSAPSETHTAKTTIHVGQSLEKARLKKLVDAQHTHKQRRTHRPESNYQIPWYLFSYEKMPT